MQARGSDGAVEVVLKMDVELSSVAFAFEHRLRTTLSVGYWKSGD